MANTCIKDFLSRWVSPCLDFSHRCRSRSQHARLRRLRPPIPIAIIKIVVPFAPGGGTDVVARTLAQEMAKDLGAIRHHREQAGRGDHHRHAVGRDQRARRLHAADGDVCQRRQSEPEREAALRRAQGFCAGGAGGALLQYRRGQSGVADQIDRGPDRGGQGRARTSSSYGTYGTGTSAHLAGELFKHMAEVNLTTVPYKGAAPAITDLIGGQIQVMFTTVASAASLVEAGPVARDRGDLGGALAGISAIADGVGSRRSRLCGRSLVRPVRAGQDAA